MYSSLRRGKNQKVISYTLFGTNSYYYEKIKNISKQIKHFYPGWFMRVYHDSSINNSIICDIECQRDENGELIDNAEFCDLSIFRTILKKKIVKPVKYVLPRMWRFLAIGDPLIDILMSRDTDSNILQREVDSVNAWLQSEKLFHIMRDSVKHTFPILAGMWGIKIVDNRSLAQYIFKLSIDYRIIYIIDPKKQKPKEGDQNFLSAYVYPLISNNSIVHDSYLCKIFGGSPFPSKREGDCFVGSTTNCNKYSLLFDECPIDCRPKDHKDWIYC